MLDELNDLNRQVLATFGQPVMIFRRESLLTESRGIISKELVPAGQFDAVLHTVTIISLPGDLKLQRGDEIQSGDQQWANQQWANQKWRVDRKVKDDGQLVQWGLHEA